MKNNKGRKFNTTNLSLCVRKKGGVIVKTLDLVKPFSKKVWLETKRGAQKGYLIENPSATLPLAVKRAIFDDFYPVAVSAFAQNKSEGFEQDVFHHLFEVGGLILAYNEDTKYAHNKFVPRGIAFRTYSYFPELGGITYIEGTAVDPAYWGIGFYQAFTKAMRARTNGDSQYFASRTQNPVVLTALHRIFGNVSPVPSQATSEMLEVGKVIASFLKMKGYDDQRMVGTKTYGGRLSGNPQTAKNDIEEKLLSLINPDNGDCVIAVCKN
jgi:hypothetical protein